MGFLSSLSGAKVFRFPKKKERFCEKIISFLIPNFISEVT